MSARHWIGLFVAALALALLAGLPLLENSDWLMLLAVPIAMYTVLATSWALFSGPTHYISLATAAFFGVGSYTVGLGIDHLPYSFLLVIAALLGALLAMLVGIATLRLSGVYFVIFTLGLAELIRQLVTWVQAKTGSRGMYVLTDLTERDIYWQLLTLTALVFLVGWLINRSRLGFALRVIGNDEVVAAHSGINAPLAKVYLFMVSGAFAAVVGAVLAPRYTYIEPSVAFSPELSFQVVIMALLGGVHRLWGPVLGVIPFTLLWEAIAASFPNQTVLLLGVAFLLIVYLIPRGIVGLAEQWLTRVQSGGGAADAP